MSASGVRVDDALFLQKESICLGSSVTPLLTEIYLSTLDIALFAYVNAMLWPSTTLLVTRYVDNIFVSSGNQ